MHILYIHQHFATPQGTTGTRSYEFARRWIKAGHSVTLITGRYDIGGLKLRKGLLNIQTIEGIKIVVVGIPYGNKLSFARRVISFLCFILFSLYASLKTERVDVIYASSTPLTVGISAIALKWLKHVPFVFEVRDQWPELPIEMGIIKNKLLTKVLLWLERTIYEQSQAIVALSPGMAEGVRSATKNGKSIVVIPNSSDVEVFRPDIDGSAVRKERGWGKKLVLLYFGAMGKANGLGFVIDVAERLKSYTDVHFVLVGDGSEKTPLIERTHQSDLNNVEITSSVTKTALPEVVAACDVSMVIFANYPILEHNSANKFFDSLSAGKPVLLNYSGWQRELLEENNAGYGCKQYNVEEFAEKVLYLNLHRASLVERGKNARQVAVEKFDRDKLADSALSLLEEQYYQAAGSLGAKQKVTDDKTSC